MAGDETLIRGTGLFLRGCSISENDGLALLSGRAKLCRPVSSAGGGPFVFDNRAYQHGFERLGRKKKCKRGANTMRVYAG